METFGTIDERQPPLGNGVVQVWRFSIGDGVTAGPDCLSVEERSRADRMRAGVARDEFVMGRRALRVLLGSLLGCHAAAVPLTTGLHGRPTLGDHGGLYFNVAHSHGLALIALSRAGRVGIDVEYRNAAVEMEAIAETSFHLEESAELRAAETEEERLLIFYRCWTRKEAVLKADGRGLLQGLNDFSVAPCKVLFEEGAAGLAVRLPGSGPLWVCDLEPEAGFAGALACDRPGFRVDLFHGGKLVSPT